MPVRRNGIRPYSPGTWKNISKNGVLMLSSLVLVQGCLCASSLGQSLSKGDGDLRVMTYNANEGTDFLEVQAATNPQQFLIAVGQTIIQVRATNPPARMQALARQIIAAAPALLSVQELDQWLTGPLDLSTFTCGPMRQEFDMVQELEDALAAQGAHYQIAQQAQQYAFPPIPGLILPGTFLCVQAINNVAILARTDLDASKFHWNNPQSGQYASTLFFPTPVGVLPLPRAWVSVDATSHGRIFRFIGTHLESVDPSIRQQQGAELRNGPAYTPFPVVLAMDSNAPATGLTPDATYIDFRAAGYSDSWSQIFPMRQGFTCCQAELDNNLVSQLSQKIDLILTVGAVKAQNVALFGVSQASKTPDGLWPSDHAGVAGQLVITE
jgi:hypothetical protein